MVEEGDKKIEALEKRIQAAEKEERVRRDSEKNA